MKFRFLRFNLLEKALKMNHDINFAADLSSDVIQFTIDLIKIQTIINSKNKGLLLWARQIQNNEPMSRIFWMRRKSKLLRSKGSKVQ